MASNIINQRVNFASIKNPMPYPDFLEVQLKSYKDFLQLDTPPGVFRKLPHCGHTKQFRAGVFGLLY